MSKKEGKNVGAPAPVKDMGQAGVDAHPGISGGSVGDEKSTCCGMHHGGNAPKPYSIHGKHRGKK